MRATDSFGIFALKIIRIVEAKRKSAGILVNRIVDIGVTDVWNRNQSPRSKITPNFGIASPMIVPDEPVKDEFAKWVENESQTKLLNRGARVPFPALFLTEAESAEVTALRPT